MSRRHEPWRTGNAGGGIRLERLFLPLPPTAAARLLAICALALMSAFAACISGRV